MTRHGLIILMLVICTSACSAHDVYDNDRAHSQRPASPRAPTPVINPAELEPLVVPAPFECRAVRNDTSVGAEQYPVPKPPFSQDMYPCTRCHDKPDDSNPTPRNLLAAHLDIKLAHGTREQWCYDCHNPSNRDKLRLAGGRLIPFETSYDLCGQCHGEKLRDWRRGVHGRRVGCWNGERKYLLCVNCHNPHSPKFESMHPMPRPRRPTEIRLERRSAP